MATVTDLNTTVRCRHCRNPVQIETYRDESKRCTAYRVYHPHRNVVLPTAVWGQKINHLADSMGYEFTLSEHLLAMAPPKAQMAIVQERLDTAMADFETRCRAAEQHVTPPPAQPSLADTLSSEPSAYEGLYPATTASVPAPEQRPQPRPKPQQVATPSAVRKIIR